MKKIPLKKWVAGMMLSATTLGAVGAINVVTNSNLVGATAYDKAGNQVSQITLNHNYDESVAIQWHASDVLIFNPNDNFSPIIDDTYTLSLDYSHTRGEPVLGVVDSNGNRKQIAGYNVLENYETGNHLEYTFNFKASNYSGYNYAFYFQILSTEESTTLSNLNIVGTIVKDEKAPVLETQVFLTDVDSPMTREYILSQVEFRDEVDGVLTPVVVNDNYTENMNKVGKWTIEVKATDKAGNVGTGVIEVWVQDKTSPIITGKSTFTSNMSSPLTEASIRSQLTASDNVDGTISDKIQVVNDGFTGNENKKGNYTITYKVVDDAGNESVVYTTTIIVVDDVKPVISVKDGYSDAYTSSYQKTISIETIKESLIVTDNVDSNLVLEIIEDKYSNASSIPGTYTISFRTTDTAGNISEVKVISITVTDEIPPVFYASGLFIGISHAQTLSHQDLVNLLLHMQGLQNTTSEVMLLSNEYNVQEINAPGVYSLSYKIVSETGEIGEVQTASIKVLGEEEVIENDEKTQIEQEARNFFQKAWDSIKEFFSVKVPTFFKNLWNSIVTYIGFGWAWDKEGKFKPNW